MRKTIAIAMLNVAWFAHAACGDLLYSVDSDTDELVSIETSTGEVTVIGSLGFDAGDIDLAFANGNLYGVDSIFGVRADLYEINRANGNATRLAPLHLLGVPVLNAEGLAAQNGNLVVGFTTTPGDYSSTLLGVVNLDGSINSGTATSIDMDALGNDFDGHLWAVDSLPHINTTALYSLQPTRIIGTYPSPLTDAPNDITVGSGTMYGATPSGLITISRTTGAITGRIDLSRPGVIYRGLAAVPEPSCLLILYPGSLLCLFRRRPTLTTYEFGPKAR